MVGRPILQSSPKVLLVEGQNDLHVVRHLCLSHNIIPAFEIVEKGNIDQLLSSIAVEIKVSGRETVGILLDTNESLNARWDAVVNRINRANIAAPVAPVATGTIIQSIPRIGIWMMPDNTSSGELEDFIERMVPGGDPVWPLSQRYVEGIPEEHRKFPNGKTLRTKLYAWLATRETPSRMGTAIGTGDLSVNGQLCQSFVNWLIGLYST